MSSKKQKVRKPGDYRFGYDVVDDNTQAEYAKIQRDDVLAFIGWKAVQCPARSYEHAFDAWWLQKAEVNFFSTDDSLRYRRELFAKIIEITTISETLVATPSATNA